MLCFCLGNDVKNSHGETVPEYNLHIQTFWRFIKDQEILLASRDIYLPQDASLDDGYYDFDEQSTPKEITATSSIFDVAVHGLKEHFGDAVVKSFQINSFGDLRIDFTNGVYFETFTPSKRKAEEWRFLTADEKEEHFVVFDV